MMKIWLILLARSPQKGFTLLELLLASIMTFFVVSATGYAILVMTRESLTNEVSSDTQFNINRAMDFMVDEAKSASSIYTSAASATTDATDFTTPSGAEVILGLNVAGLPQPIIYYVEPKTNSDVWFGPNIIYRWGPSFCPSNAPTGWVDTDGCADNAGNFVPYNGYIYPDDPSKWGDGNNKGIALVDGVPSTSYFTRIADGTRISLSGVDEQQSQKKCPAGGISSDIASGWTAIPGIVSGTTYLGETTGFFVCVSNDGRQVEIHAYASLADELQSAGSTDSRGFDKASYGVVTQVFARSATP